MGKCNRGSRARLFHPTPAPEDYRRGPCGGSEERYLAKDGAICRSTRQGRRVCRSGNCRISLHARQQLLFPGAEPQAASRAPRHRVDIRRQPPGRAAAAGDGTAALRDPSHSTILRQERRGHHPDKLRLRPSPQGAEACDRVSDHRGKPRDGIPADVRDNLPPQLPVHAARLGLLFGLVERRGAPVRGLPVRPPLRHGEDARIGQEEYGPGPEGAEHPGRDSNHRRVPLPYPRDQGLHREPGLHELAGDRHERQDHFGFWEAGPEHRRHSRGAVPWVGRRERSAEGLHRLPRARASAPDVRPPAHNRDERRSHLSADEVQDLRDEVGATSL
mmetsp:Transcript_33149/g.80538  ORF Transcript_33149/g.80538 Transcript_33149/m.80538 type:complete len:331 (-) Transcript_33149:5417-6409(-)